MSSDQKKITPHHLPPPLFGLSNIVPFRFLFCFGGFLNFFGSLYCAPSPGNRDSSDEARLHGNVSEQGQPPYLPGDSDLRRREFVFLICFFESEQNKKKTVFVL